jgi:myosin I
VRAKPTPPAPPVKRPVAGVRKALPPPTPARDSAVSLGSDSLRPSSGTDSGRATPNSIGGGSLAGGLAEALRARQSAMSGNAKEDDDDW